MTMWRWLVLGSLLTVVAAPVACRSGGPRFDADAMSSMVRTQVKLGADLYRQHCASCHGDDARGTHRAPALAGRGALPREPRLGSARERRFVTARDVGRFTIDNMPPVGDPLAAEDTWAILAFAIDANGIAMPEPLGPATAASVVLRPEPAGESAP